MYLTYVSKFKQKNSMKNISLHGLFLKSNGSSKNIEKSFKYEGFSFGGREKLMDLRYEIVRKITIY